MDGPTHAMPPVSRLDDMTQRLRLRICLMDPDQTHILYENSLAEEFGVSRTPVRQVLQRLAYESQVETRTGVGTVVPQLDRGAAARDFRLLAGLLDLASEAATHTLEPPARLLLGQLGGQIENRDLETGTDATGLFASHSWLIAFVRHLVSEPILADAIASLHWRALRRLLQQDIPQKMRQRQILDQLCHNLLAQTDARAALKLISLAITDLGELAGPA